MKPVDIEFHIKETVHSHKNYYKIISRVVHNYEDDSRKEKRLKEQECRYCTYVDSKIGGSAITFSKCEICGKEIYNSSTNVDFCCEDCAKEYKICKHCGGSMD